MYIVCKKKNTDSFQNIIFSVSQKKENISFQDFALDLKGLILF